MTWHDAVSVRAVWVRRRPGPLLVPFDAPSLEVGAVIDRGWVPRMGSGLLVPKADPRKYLPTYPLPEWEPFDGHTWFPHDPRPLFVTIDPSNYL